MTECEKEVLITLFSVASEWLARNTRQVPRNKGWRDKRPAGPKQRSMTRKGMEDDGCDASPCQIMSKDKGCLASQYTRVRHYH
jgi:hypothetical protein